MIVPFGGGSLGYWAIFVLSIILGLATQGWVNSTFRRYSRTAPASGQTGAQAARRILDANGLQNVTIEQVAGNLTDHFDPKTNTLRLSESVYGSASISAVGVAAHESGHALQHAAGYSFAKFRSALVPAANFGSRFWVVLLILGSVMNLMGLVWLGIIAFAASVLFQLVTLPVEFDASRRALAELDRQQLVTGPQLEGARSVLTAAAMTYLAAALISVLYLIYFIGGARDR